MLTRTSTSFSLAALLARLAHTLLFQKDFFSGDSSCSIASSSMLRSTTAFELEPAGACTLVWRSLDVDEMGGGVASIGSTKTPDSIDAAYEPAFPSTSPSDNACEAVTGIAIASDSKVSFPRMPPSFFHSSDGILILSFCSFPSTGTRELKADSVGDATRVGEAVTSAGVGRGDLSSPPIWMGEERSPAFGNTDSSGGEGRSSHAVPPSPLSFAPALSLAFRHLPNRILPSFSCRVDEMEGAIFDRTGERGVGGARWEVDEEVAVWKEGV